METKLLRYIVTISVFLALFVVMLGAYTRLTNAGLGCPDWPGCYGQMILPIEKSDLTHAQVHYPTIPIEAKKAWTEMIHRYAAGTLALFIFFIAGYTGMKKTVNSVWKIPCLLVCLVFFQAALGMWTVTLKLLPIVVMSHLLGGILIFSCLSRLRFQLSPIAPIKWPQAHLVVALGILLLFCQIALGGWVSANYAGLSCVGFPQCNGKWFPALHFSQGFNLFSHVGANYQGGVLAHTTRMTILFIHRLGAYVTAVYLMGLVIFVLRNTKNARLRFFTWMTLLLVGLQFILGIMNVVYLLPLGVAVAHNGVAALLMANLFITLYLTSRK